MTHFYSPEVYNVRNQQEAKGIILTPQSGMTPEDRWSSETPYLCSLIEREVPTVRQDVRVLDYGCGIGRMSKEMIERYNAHVFGVDISWSMRALAVDYVRHDRFMVGAPAWMDMLNLGGRGFHMALAIWVLQHCAHPGDDLSRIALGLKKQEGCLFVVNELRRVVPARSPTGEIVWADDGFQMRSALRALAREVVAEGKMDPKVVGEEVSANTFWGVYRF